MQDLTLSDIHRNDGQLISLAESELDGAEDLSEQEQRLLTRFDRSAQQEDRSSVNGSEAIALTNFTINNGTLTDFDLSQTPKTEQNAEDRQWHEQS